jgi:hypothetical protein
MKTNGMTGKIFGLILLGLLVSACSMQVDRNNDGSLTVEAAIPEVSVQQEIEAGLDDPLIVALHAELHDGYIQASGERTRPLGEGSDAFSFVLRLSVQDGHLATEMSEATFGGRPVDERLVSVWNERLAARLERAGRRSPNVSLQSANVSEESLIFVWHVETLRSRAD